MRLPLAALVCCASGLAATQETVVKHLDVPVAMRDGVKLSANVFHPVEPRRYPTILLRTPYGKGTGLTPTLQAFVDRGYAVVVQDVRGRYASRGTFRPLEQEPNDGDDTLNWIAQQAWSDGKIGMTGGSYVGIVQWKVATLNNPHLKAIFPIVSGDDDYRDRFYSPGGALKLGQRLLWMSENLRAQRFHPDFAKFVLHLPLRTSDVAATGQTSEMYQKEMAHPTYDAFWKAISVRDHLDQIHVPVFSVGGWYDNFVESDLDAYAGLHKTPAHRVLIGPWPHNMSTPFKGVNFGPDSYVPLRGLQLQWFDQYLKGEDTPLKKKPPVRVFLMGANEWRDETAWPPHAHLTAFYLSSDGDLRRHQPKGAAFDQFVYDPKNPVPTVGGAVCCNPRIFPWGPLDQREVERRKDILVYTTTPLDKTLDVIGPVRVVLYASTSARDTDFTAKLVDVFPDGEARILTDGILRLRYRKSLEQVEFAQPDQIYKITIDAGVTANAFLKGHRIRVEISSSNFPRFDRNLNTGASIADGKQWVKASQTVYHDAEHRSHLLLPVVQE